VTLIVIHCNDFDSYNGGIFKAATELLVLMKVYTICYHGEVTLMLCWFLQSCTDSLHVLPGSSCETFPTSSDSTYDVGNVKVEVDIDIKEEVDMKQEKGIGNEEEEEKDIDTKEDEDIHIKEEVSCVGTV